MPKSKHEKMQELQNEIAELEVSHPHRKSLRELALEKKAKEKKEVEYLSSDACKEWREKYPERYKADMERLGGKLPKQKVAKAKKPEKEEEPKKEVEEPLEEKKEKKEKPKKSKK